MTLQLCVAASKHRKPLIHLVTENNVRSTVYINILQGASQIDNNVISRLLLLHMCLRPRSIPRLAMRKLLIMELWTICAFRWLSVYPAEDRMILNTRLFVFVLNVLT